MINLLTNKLKGAIINTESEGNTMKLQIVNGDYERLLDDNDNIITNYNYSIFNLRAFNI